MITDWLDPILQTVMFSSIMFSRNTIIDHALDDDQSHIDPTVLELHSHFLRRKNKKTRGCVVLQKNNAR